MDGIKLWARDACNSRHAQMVNNHISKSQRWTSENPRNTLYGALLILALLYFSTKISQRLRKIATPSRPGTPDLEREKPIASEESKKNKFACEIPGGTYPILSRIPPPSQLINITNSLDTLLLPSSTGSTLPRLVHRNNKTPSLPSLPPKILCDNGTALHALGLLDRTRQ